MRRLIRAFGVAAGFGFVAAPASAIVINDVSGEARMTELAAGFSSVVRLDRAGVGPWCSGSLISASVVLTAKHCVQDGTSSSTYSPAAFQIAFTDGGATPTATRGVSAISYLGSLPFSLLDGADLALMTLVSPVLDVTPLRLFGEDPTGLEVTMVGFGDHGLGSAGRLNDYDGVKRAATNVVDFYGPGTDGVSTGGANIVSTDFDSPAGDANTLSAFGSDPVALTDEGTTAPGDSGGPLLISMGSEWVIGGVLSGGTTADSVYGDISWWTGVISDAARGFIEDGGGTFYVAATAVPLPGAGLMMLAGLAALGAMRRRA